MEKAPDLRISNSIPRFEAAKQERRKIEGPKAISSAPAAAYSCAKIATLTAKVVDMYNMHHGFNLVVKVILSCRPAGPVWLCGNGVLILHVSALQPTGMKEVHDGLSFATKYRKVRSACLFFATLRD